MELFRANGQSAVRKTYRNSGSGLLQTLLRKSRARREYENLTAVRAAGLPCTEALKWEEERSLGCVRRSALVTRYEPRCTPVREILRAGASRAERRWLLEEMGRLAARLHRAGFLWCTLTPRNFLLQGVVGRGTLLLSDMPAAVRFRRSIYKTQTADPDVYDAAFSAGRQLDFSDRERRRLLIAYSGGDRGYIRELERRLKGRSRLVHRLRKSIRKVISVYLRPSWLQGSKKKTGTDR